MAPNGPLTDTCGNRRINAATDHARLDRARLPAHRRVQLGVFVTDVNVLDLLLEQIWDPLDDVLFILIALAGLYWLARVVLPERR